MFRCKKRVVGQNKGVVRMARAPLCLPLDSRLSIFLSYSFQVEADIGLLLPMRLLDCSKKYMDDRE